jgi:hypothetical protein
MSGYLKGSAVAAIVMLAAMPVAYGQAAKAPGKDSDREMRLNGCITRDTITPGQFNFLEDDGGGKYRLTGKGVKNFVGKRVEIVGGPPGKRVTFRTGLWPSPNVAAQAGHMDPAEAAVARMPGGAADAPGASVLPEFRVARVRAVEGACQ